MAHSFQVRPVRVQSFALHKQAATVYKNKTPTCVFCGRLYGVKTLRAAKVSKKTIKLCRICGLFCRGWKYVWRAGVCLRAVFKVFFYRINLAFYTNFSKR